MWTCPSCQRVFGKAKQPHSCRTVRLEEHFKNKDRAHDLFSGLLKEIRKIGNARVISLPCCIHLFGTYDFLAALPKKDRLEIRFSLRRSLDSPLLKQSVPVSSTLVKNCIDLYSPREIDEELLAWIREAYFLKRPAV